MELKRLTAIFLRWKWLLVIGTLLAAVSAFVTSSLITPTFEASTTLLINQAQESQTFDYTAILASERLTRTYAELLTKRPILEEAISRLGLRIEVEDLDDAINVQPVMDTQLIELKVESTNPILAASLANAIVEVFTEQNDAFQASRFAASKSSLSTQLDKISEQIQIKEAAIAALATPDTETVSAELIRLQTELVQNQTSFTNLLQSYEEIRIAEALSVSSILQVEPAELPEEPIRPHILLNTLVAGVMGGMVALGIVFLIEYLDDTIRSTEDVVRVTQVPVIGYVVKSKKLTQSGTRQRFLISEPKSALAESFRSLKTNIELAGIQGIPRSILVASPEPGDGKTTVAAQLAVSIAQGGKRVVLLDANLRQPRLHDYFGIGNKLGLSDMLVDDLVPQVVAQESIHWRLKIITSGKPVDNPAELMGSVWMLKVLSRLREQADVAIFDGPPFPVAESFILASKLESVLMVMQLGRTSEGVAETVVEQLDRAQANLIGVVLNRVPRRKAYDYNVYFGDFSKGNVVPNSEVILRRQPNKQFPVVKEKESSFKD